MTVTPLPARNSAMAGRCLRSYTFACWCGAIYTVLSPSTVVAVDKDRAEEQAHKAGWRHQPVAGWTCPKCRPSPAAVPTVGLVQPTERPELPEAAPQEAAPQEAAQGPL